MDTDKHGFHLKSATGPAGHTSCVECSLRGEEFSLSRRTGEGRGEGVLGFQVCGFPSVSICVHPWLKFYIFVSRFFSIANYLSQI